MADKNGGIDWLNTVPNTRQNDMCFVSFIDGVDAIIIGRSTFEMVIGFGVPWPYTKPYYCS